MTARNGLGRANIAGSLRADAQKLVGPARFSGSSSLAVNATQATSVVHLLHQLSSFYEELDVFEHEDPNGLSGLITIAPSTYQGSAVFAGASTASLSLGQLSNFLVTNLNSFLDEPRPDEGFAQLLDQATVAHIPVVFQGTALFVGTSTLDVGQKIFHLLHQLSSFFEEPDVFEYDDLNGLGGLASPPTWWQTNTVFAGSGSVNLHARLAMLAAASDAGLGSLSSAINDKERADAALAGAGSFSAAASARSPVQGTALLAGNSATSLSIVDQESSTAILAGSSTLSAVLDIHGKVQASAVFAGDSSTILAISDQEASSATFIGASASALGTLSSAESATTVFAGVGSFVGASPIAKDAAVAAFSGSSVLATNVSTTEAAIAILSGTGDLSSTAARVEQIGAAFIGAGLLSGLSAQKGAALSQLAGVGAIAASVQKIDAARTAFIGTSTEIASVNNNESIGASFDSVNSVFSVIEFKGFPIASASLPGLSNAAASTVARLSVTSNMNGQSGADQLVALIKQISANLLGASTLSGQTGTANTRTADAAFAGAGSIIAIGKELEAFTTQTAGTGGLETDADVFKNAVAALSALATLDVGTWAAESAPATTDGASKLAADIILIPRTPVTLDVDAHFVGESGLSGMLGLITAVEARLNMARKVQGTDVDFDVIYGVDESAEISSRVRTGNK